MYYRPASMEVVEPEVTTISVDPPAAAAKDESSETSLLDRLAGASQIIVSFLNTMWLTHHLANLQRQTQQNTYKMACSHFKTKHTLGRTVSTGWTL
jgi:hypothetical protein